MLKSATVDQHNCKQQWWAHQYFKLAQKNLEISTNLIEGVVIGSDVEYEMSIR